MKLLNRMLKATGWMLAPRPPSGKMLLEYANTGEHFHPSRGGNTVRWMRRVASMTDYHG